jgi:hypothetical protein
MFVFNISTNGQEHNSEKCDISVIVEMNETNDNITEDLMLSFLKTFGEECKNNTEFIEFSNEALFKIIQNEPELFCKVLENHMNQIEIEIIISDLKSPLHDLIDLDLTINKIADTKINSSLKSQMILAINSANWDESKKIKKYKNPTLLFFYPDSIQFHKIANSENYEGIYEVSSDFEFYANAIIELYQDSTLNVTISDNRFFTINNELIDAFDQASPYGLILVKRDDFKIETGVFTDVGIQQMINEYYNPK